MVVMNKLRFIFHLQVSTISRFKAVWAKNWWLFWESEKDVNKRNLWLKSGIFWF